MQDLFDQPDAREAKPPASTARPVPPARRGFAGFSWFQLVAGLALIGGAVWGAWITREVTEIKARRIVAVSLSAMINDFVMTEARSGNSPEQVERDTRHFMALLQGVLGKRAAAGTTILVGEAVVSSSVPDVTAEVRAEVGRLITANVPAAPPPATENAAQLQPLAPALPAQTMPAQGPQSPAPITGASDGLAQ